MFPLRRVGLLRVGLAAALAAVLWLTGGLGDWAAYLAVILAAIYGMVLASGLVASRLARRSGPWMVAGDVALISLLVAGTGGADSPFSTLYLLAAFGAVGGAGFAPSAAIAVAGYLAAVTVPAGSLVPLISAVTGLQTALITLAFYLAGRLDAQLRDARRESEARATSLASEESYGERLDASISRLGRLLDLMRPEDILQWAAETAREAAGAAYVHVALPEGNLHRTSADEGLESCPSWWHPEVQRLVLWSSRSGEVLREETSLPGGIEGFVAVPVALEEGPGVGALLAGGTPGGEVEERILHRIALEAARALASREEAPGGRDPISRLPNRASLMRVLHKEWGYGGRITLLHAGLDGFGRYCEVHGLSAGEDLLRRIGGRIGGQQRAFHTGADEFVLLVGGGNGARVRRAALGVREAVIEVTGTAAVPLTACVGIAPIGGPRGEGWTPAEALSGARRALERAKSSPEGMAYAAEPGAEPEGVETPGVVYALVEAAEAHDEYLGEHLRSVSRLARAVGRQLGLPEQRLESLATGALLHDVGKIGLRQSLLQKPGPLDAVEYEEMKLHPEIGVKILEPIEELSHTLPVVKHHHERCDGGGYPDGLAREEISLEARITLVADALDSMVRDRAYRKGTSLEVAVREITAGSGSQFDPEVVSALLSLLDSGDGTLRLAN